MTTPAKLLNGTFLRIPLEDGSFGYGRALTDPYIAFYNYRTMAPDSDLDVIASKPVLFVQAIRHRGLERWEMIGNRGLEDQLTKPIVRFTQDLADFRQCTIFDSTGVEKAASPEECVGLERAAVWEPPHIEARLLDTFLGRPNAVEEHLRVRLS